MEDSSGGNDPNSCLKYTVNAGPRPYRCEICQRSFREIATLRKHEQLHRADRPYVCQTCGKSFLWSSNLKVHERVHTGERPYKCKICHRCFTQSNDLRRHERNVHMRGKLYGYRNSGRPTAQVNLAAYQAFAMQQRALLQQALTYETLIHNTAATSQENTVSNPDQPQNMQNEQYAISIHNAIKLEQVTPPSTPSEMEDSNINKNIGHQIVETSSTSHVHISTPPTLYAAIPMSRSVIQSPPTLPPVAELTSPNSMRSESPKDKNKQYPSTSSASQTFSSRSGTPLSSLPNLPQTQLIPQSTLDRTTEDSVMDLSINKHVSVAGNSSGEYCHWKRSSYMHSKTPSLDSESEEKRDVTTTSATPTTDVGFHQCYHCGIFFHDYTMFHLHQSLHSPLEEDPFRCPSCHKHCQDRIEFTFHIVWHVKYPHTIPNYQPFKESYLR